MRGVRFKLENGPSPAATVFAGHSGLNASAIASTPGYRSGAACLADQLVCIATGPGGADILLASHWLPLVSQGYDSVDSTGRVFWFSGDGGRIGRLVLPEQDAEASK